MEKQQVMVLLSTYNGERYLREQIASLLAQKNVNIRILIRDDGSTDGTVEILKELSSDDRISCYFGENKGYSQSFLDLIQNAPAANFYAFCDQDDVWFENKLSNAIIKLNCCDSSTPNLYISNFNNVDSNLNYLSKSDFQFETPYTLQSTIIGRSVNGCAMVFNEKTKELFAMKSPKKLRVHDYWTLMIVEAFMGTIVYDDEAQFMYRIHENNAIGNINCIKRFAMLFKSFKSGNNERWNQSVEFYELYKDVLPCESIESLKTIVNYRRSLRQKIKLLSDKSYRTYSKKINIMFFIAVVLGVF
jgi:rhamnosyltransferase